MRNFILLHLADNEGSNKEAGVFGKGNCPFPCRMCECPRSRLFDVNIDDIPYRDDEYVTTVLDGAWDAFCKSMKRVPGTDSRVPLTVSEQYILNECARLSIYPIKPYMMLLDKPYPEYTMYESFPPDLMHTLIAGLMVGWVSLALVCCAVIGEMPEYRGHHRYNLGVLDAAIANLPRHHSVSYPMRHFRRGVSCFCPKSATVKSKQGGTTSVLGMINHQEVPDLMLQVLLCK